MQLVTCKWCHWTVGVIVCSCWFSKVDSSSSLVQYRSYVQFSGSVHMDFFFSIWTERLIRWWSQVSIVFRSDYTLEGDHSDSTISTITEPYLSPKKVMHLYALICSCLCIYSNFDFPDMLLWLPAKIERRNLITYLLTLRSCIRIIVSRWTTQTAQPKNFKRAYRYLCISYDRC